MSWIDSEHKESLLSDASLDAFETVLKEDSWKTLRTKYSITATKKNMWKSTVDTLTIVDDNTIRHCDFTSTSKGYAMRPNVGVLAEIVSKAETHN